MLIKCIKKSDKLSENVAQIRASLNEVIDFLNDRAISSFDEFEHWMLHCQNDYRTHREIYDYFKNSGDKENCSGCECKEKL